MMFLNCNFTAVAIAMSAIGAHAVKLSDNGDMYYKNTYETANRFHIIHSIGLLLVSRALNPTQNHLSKAGLLFAGGICLFSGSLYAVAIQRDRQYGKFAPFGGMCFILGWLCLAWRR